MSQSVLQFLGLPIGFGYVLLVLALILSLAPWLHGHDFGVLKVPPFAEPQRRALQRIGPAALLLAIGLHVPFLAAPPGDGAEPREASATPDRTVAAAQPVPDGADVRDPAAAAAASPRVLLAEHDGGGCLYPVRLLKRDGPDAQVHFQFDERVTIPLARVFMTTEPTIEIGAALFAKLPTRDAWLPVTVRGTRTTRVQVTRDDTTACAAEFGKPTQWVPRSSVTGIAPLGDTP